MSVSVIVPCSDEPTVREVVYRVCAVPMTSREVIVVDDGSVEAIRPFPELPEVKILRHATRRGKGAAVRSGLAISRGAIVVIQDADLEYAPEDLPLLIEPLRSGRADVVLGSRRLARQGNAWPGYLLNRAASGMLTELLNAVAAQGLTDITTGHKAFLGHAVRSCLSKDEGFAWDVSIVTQLSRKRCRFAEVPIRYMPRSYRQGKKIVWADFFRSAYAILRDAY